MTDNNEKVKVVVDNKGNDPKENKESIQEIILDWVKTIAIALLIATFIKLFIMDATRVAGNSMLNTLHHNDMLMMNKIGKHFGDYDRGDIVILKAPDYANRLYVKRVVAVPGDTVKLKDEKIYINGEELVEPYTSVDYTMPTSDKTEWMMLPNQYFVVGDNRMEGASNDSRNFGPIIKDEIVGHAFLRFYPFSDFGLIDNNPYGDN